MSKENLQGKSCKELRERARELNIVGRWDMTKEQLIEAILGVENAMDSENKTEKVNAIFIHGGLSRRDQVIRVGDQSANDECKVDNPVAAASVVAEVKVENESAGAKTSDQKMSYVEGVEIGTIVAFRLSNGKVKSAKVVKKSTKNRKLKLETDYHAEYIVSYDDIVWVRTGKRWPRGVYNLLKGLVDDGKEQIKA